MEFNYTCLPSTKASKAIEMTLLKLSNAIKQTNNFLLKYSLIKNYMAGPWTKLSKQSDRLITALTAES